MKQSEVLKNIIYFTSKKQYILCARAFAKTALSIVFLLSINAASLWAVMPKSAQDYLKEYDAMMGPLSFESTMEMTAHRDDGSTRTYQMKVLKANNDKLRIWFSAPASAKGQELLRVADNLWTYMPNIKKAIRLASRDSFQGGDFNNADILRANLSQDFTVEYKDGAKDNEVILELKAKHQDTSYDRILLWLDQKTATPIKGEYYALSGKLLRSAVFLEVKDFSGFKRPSQIIMKNELQTERYSILKTNSFKLVSEVPVQKFVLDDLGR